MKVESGRGPGVLRVVPLVAALIAPSGTALATTGASPLTSGTFECGEGADAFVLALFVSDDGRSECRGFDAGRIAECRNGAGDLAVGDCRLGCAALRGAAGCVHARAAGHARWNEPLPVVPRLTIECQGKSYDLSPAKSGGTDSECHRETDASGITTGGECTSTDEEGDPQSDAKVDCERGCEYERNGATCKKR